MNEPLDGKMVVERWFLFFLPQVVFGYLKMLFLVEHAKEC